MPGEKYGLVLIVFGRVCRNRKIHSKTIRKNTHQSIVQQQRGAPPELEGKSLAFTPNQVGNESILATNDIHCVPKCSSQYRHLNQYQVQVRGYEHISCNVLANAMVKHNSPMDNTSQPLVMTLRVLEWVRHDTTLVSVIASSTACSGQQVGSIQSSHSQAEVSSQSKPEAMDKKADSIAISNHLYCSGSIKLGPP